MKIAFLTVDISQAGGVERVVTTLSNHLIQRHDVDIISVGNKSSPALPFPIDEKVRLKWLDISHVDGTILKKIIRHILNAKKIISNLTGTKYDIIISTSIFYNLYVLVGKPFINSKVIVSEHMQYNNVNKIIRRISKILYKAADAIITLNKSDKDRHWKRFRKAEWILNPIPFLCKEKSTLKEKYIISVGRLSEEKGFPRLIECFYSVHEKYSDWKLVIVGEGKCKDDIVRIIKEKRLEENVAIKNFTDKIQEEYKNASIYALASYNEGLPMVLLEAQECGLPVVAFKINEGISEVVYDGQNGILVNNDDRQEFSNALIELIEDEGKRMRFGMNACINLSNYSSEEVFAKWGKLINHLGKK